MPNHVMNRITLDCSDERAKEIMEAVMFNPNPEDEENTGFGTLDFNKLVPMPESLMIEAGSATERGIEIYLTAVNPDTKDYGFPKMPEDEFEKLVNDLNRDKPYVFRRPFLFDDEIQKYTMYTNFEKLAETGKQAVDNLINYGYTCWYDFCTNEWGTKWNSYDPVKENDHGFQFCTAWTAPHPILEALAAKYPDVHIIHEWADEDIGQNCGKSEYVCGECSYCDTSLPRLEAIKFATGLWGYTPEDYGMELNASGTDYIYTGADEYELVKLFGKPALFTSDRLTQKDIPQGLYLSHVRGDDETTGGFALLEPRVLVNHFGSIVTKEPIDFGDKGFIEFTPETEPHFTGKSVTFADFVGGRFTLDDGPGETNGISMI